MKHKMLYKMVNKNRLNYDKKALVVFNINLDKLAGKHFQSIDLYEKYYCVGFENSVFNINMFITTLYLKSKTYSFYQSYVTNLASYNDERKASQQVFQQLVE